MEKGQKVFDPYFSAGSVYKLNPYFFKYFDQDKATDVGEKMKTLRLICLLMVIIIVNNWGVPLDGANAVIPGDINQICRYTSFFYNLPSADFFYYMNDRLLFTESQK